VNEASDEQSCEDEHGGRLGDELRVITGARLRQLAHNASEHLLPWRLSAEVIVSLPSEGVSVARLAPEPLQPSASGETRRAVVVIDLGEGKSGEAVLDVLAGDWDSLPTVAEFDAELDAARPGTRER
jgi:hypothetical protein